MWQSLCAWPFVIQTKFQYSDRELVEQIAENPYPQRFYGLSGYQDEAPFDASIGKRITMEMVMEANESVHSRKAIEHFTIDDIGSGITYKKKVNKRFPKKKYIEMSNQDFLTEIGVCFVDSVSGEVKLRRGVLLFVGAGTHDKRSISALSFRLF